MFHSSSIALAVFLLTYAVIGFGRLPPLRIDRTGAALVGATAMVAFGVLTPHEAVQAVDFQTLALLTGMMVVAAYLRLADNAPGPTPSVSGTTIEVSKEPGRIWSAILAPA